MFLTYGYFLVPLMMIIHGVMTYNDKPTMDAFVGYRTKRSLNCEETFVYANKLVSEYFIRFNCISLLITIICFQMYTMFGKDMKLIVQIVFFLSMTAIQVTCCIVPFILVESKLKVMIDQKELEAELREEQEYNFDDYDDSDSIDELIGIENKSFFYGKENIL